ncbi:PEP-CTERM sorting domain-containing protein [Desulfopila sp. IMCC35008]|uniref:PEP-CTERM sorting domain-containing protein n=1 Tax=Desulfopila sp. IMCC35008 TaxID=2653858 RepID=UPI00197AB13F|nr:PEP-CTERM sorting domain-containing protein [Desulfopila sp. IMCC35008]
MGNIKKGSLLGIVVGLVSFILPLGSMATAASISWDLNCYIDSNKECQDSSLFGTMTLTDTTIEVDSTSYNAIEIFVDLVDPISAVPANPNTFYKVLEIALNYDDSYFPAPTGAFMLTNVKTQGQATASVVSVDEDKLKIQNADGFDLNDDVGEWDPWKGTLYHTGTALDISLFTFTAFGSDLYAGVHIGNYGSIDELTTGEDSITVGARNPVPEPATMLLFGTGLAGLAGISRRKKK